ncbi:tetratricopeptide repeat protein [bacterium]|nr:tetratricopeptide repeat protein [bacterium]
MPASPGEMYVWILKRLEGVVGPELARCVIRLLNISRSGWREQDLEALIPTLTGEPFDPLRLAVLRRLLRGRLVQSGQFGQWRIADQSLWWTVRRELQADPPLWIHMASAVADYLEPLSRDDPMRQEEYLQQLIPARRPATLVAGYTDDALSESELLAIERTFCWEILTTMREGRDNSGVEYILYLLFLQEVDDRQRCLLCGRVLDRLLPSLEHNTPLTVRRQLLDGVDRALASLAERMQDDVGWLATRAAYEGLNGLHAQKEGNHAPALAALEESRALWQRAVDQRDDASEAPRIEWRQALAEACQAIGHRYLGADQPTRAQGRFQEARQVLESLLLEAPGNRVAKALLGAAHDDLGDVLKTQGDLEGALESFERGRDIFEQLETKEPDELNWKHHLAVNGERIGNMLGGLGRSQACLEAHQKTLELREFLTKRAPYDVNQQKNLAITLRDVGDALKDVGEPPAAPYMQYSRARRIYEHLLAEDPGDTRVAMLLAGLLERYDTSMDVISGRQPGSGLKDAIGIWKGLVEHDPDNAQWRRGLARAYRKTGEVLQDAHASEKAAQAYRQSLEHLQHLVVLDPTDVSLQATLAGVHRDIGDGMLDTGNPAAAAASFQEALSLDERIIAQRPDRQSDRRTARDFLNLGMAYKQMGRYKDAVKALDRTSEIARRRLDEAADDGFRHDLFVAIDHKGEMLLAEDDCDGALQCFEEGLRHMLASNADEWEAEDYHNQGIAHQRIGTVLLKQGDAEKARERFEQTRDLCQKALDMEPDSLNRLYQMSNANGKLGNALLGQGDIEAARIAYQSSLKVCEKLAERDPTNPQWTRNLGITREKLADVALAENDVPAALEALGEADRIRSKLQAEHPDDAALTRDLAVSAYRTAEILGQTGQGQAAQPHIFRLHQILSHMQKAGMYIDPPLQDVLQRLEQQGIAQDIAAAAQQQETGTTTLKCPACGAAVMSMRGRRRMQGGTVGCGTCGKSFPSEQLVAEYKEE